VLPKAVKKVEAGKETVCEDLVLTRGGLVTGKVVDRETGEPLEHACVSASLSAWFSAELEHVFLGPRSVPFPETFTASDGRYRLRLPPGRWRVQSPTRAGYFVGGREHHQEVTMALDKTLEGVNFAMGKSREIRGRVVGPDGQPVPNAILTSPFHIRGVEAQEDGTFTLEWSPQNEPVSLYAFSPDGASGTMMELPPHAGEADTFTLMLSPAVEVRGRVVDEKGQPAKDARVRAAPRAPLFLIAGGCETMGSAITDAEGRFGIKVVRGIDYALEANAEGYGWARLEEFIPEREHENIGTLTLKKASAFVAGRVTDGAGNPLKGVRVQAQQPPDLRRPRMAFTDAQGRYRIEKLVQGNVEIFIRRDDTPSERQETQTGAENVDFVLRP
jgi:protocatechuate 3,4-dioxygenase beta subunit